MSTPLLVTKLYIPPARANIVRRPALLQRLNAGRAGRLTLISAPAGFGKTTLVSEWLAGGAGPAAWLSLDAGDNDLPRFLTYLVAALQTAAPGVGAAALAALQSAQPPPAESLLTALLNDLAALPGGCIVVLDDYHLIDSPAVDAALVFWVEHLPPGLHLVIASREDPPLPLARLRARGQLTELRDADLRFTPAEAADFLNRVMGLSLPAPEIAALENRTEGWIAGLQLAALSMQNRQDTAGFIRSFTGSHRFVLDYLVEEVLQRQAEPVRSFLLQTSILERLSGPLCDAITGQADGSATLETLERSNLFVIALDDGRQWYRYHHLFAEVLQAYLHAAQPGQLPVLHRRASLWFEHNDLPAEAIRHALAAADFERAAALIERIWLVMDLNYQSAAWLAWAKALPDELVRAHPVLCLGYAWALLNGGELEASEARLQDAERWLAPSGAPTGTPDGMVVVDEAEFRSLPASIAGARAYRALALGDIAATKIYARQTLALVQPHDRVRRTQATALLGMAEYASGNLKAAEQALLKFQELMWQANDVANAVSITFILADIKLVQGRLREAAGAYRQALLLAENLGTVFFLGASDLYRGLSELLCEQGNLAAAAEHLQTAQQVGEHGALTGWPQRLCAAQARLKEAQGDPAGALALLDEAERQFVRSPLPERSIAALKARAWLRQGRLAEALAWVSQHNLSPNDELSYLHEFEHLTLARVLIARAQAERTAGLLKDALKLLSRLLAAAQAGKRGGSRIEILIVQALAYQAQGSLPHALSALEQALALAEGQGYLRIFVDEGPTLRALLEDLVPQCDYPLSGYAQNILAALAPPPPAPPSPQAPARPPQTALLEPLSERELEVLRLLRGEMSGPELAEHLMVSLNTLRTHTKNIFGKLGVNNRRAAVHRAEELGLF